MKILLTGSTGFVGRHIVAKLLKERHDVTVLLREGKPSPFEGNVSVRHVGRQTIQDFIAWMKAQVFDGIIHLASLYITAHKPEDVNELLDSNVCLGSYILECAVQAKIPWFVNTGTFWQHYQNKDYSPVNLYAATKQAFESIAQYYWESNKIKFCTLKISDTFGPDDTRPKIFNYWENIAKTGEVLDMSPGEQIIDISHIDDIVNAFYLLAQHLTGLTGNKINIPNGAIYAVKAKKRYTLKELAQLFEKATGEKLNINWGGRSYREREVMIPWDQGKTVPWWEPEISVEKGIKSIMQ